MPATDEEASTWQSLSWHRRNEEETEGEWWEFSAQLSHTLLVSFISRSINCIIAGCSLKQFSSFERALSSSRRLPLFTSFAFHSTRLPTHIEFFLSFFILYLIPISFRSCPNDIYVNFTQEYILFDIWKWQKKSFTLLAMRCLHKFSLRPTYSLCVHGIFDYFHQWILGYHQRLERHTPRDGRQSFASSGWKFFSSLFRFAVAATHLPPALSHSCQTW